MSNYTPDYRETSSIGKRKLLTPDEVLRLPLDKALVILRGQKVLKVDKFDYTLHPDSKKLTPCKAVEHIPKRSTPSEVDVNVEQEPAADIKPEPKTIKNAADTKPTIEAVDLNDIFKKGNV